MSKKDERPLEGKVVLVTGAGQGIGRAIALRAAAEGAQVVVNDLATEEKESGSRVELASEVAREIGAVGGTAIANTDSIADREAAERMVAAAIDKFGRIDCVINNAGILRDRMFWNMGENEWDEVIRVHLKGYYNVSRAAAPHFKEQKSGSYVHFTSVSGLIGSVGQANYIAAKLGVVGLSLGIAHDMARYNVRSNCIGPSAWSRLLAGVPIRDEAHRARMDVLRTKMRPEQIAPLCTFLASDLSQGVTGQIFTVRGNEVALYTQPRPLRTVHNGDGWTTESLAEVMLPAFKRDFYPLVHHTEMFDWPPF